MVSDNLVKKFSDAVERAEGYGEPGAIPTRANNPGDLTDEGNIGLGQIQSGGRGATLITIYPDYATGRAALEKKVRRMLNGASETYHLGDSISEVGAKWAEVREWGDNVASDLGVSPLTTLGDLAIADQNEQGNG